MIYFELIRKYFKTMGVNLSDAERPTVKILLKNVIYFLFMGPIYCGLSSAYIYTHRDDLTSCNKAIATFFCCSCGALQIIFIKMKEHKIGLLIDDVQKMIEKGLFVCLFVSLSSNERQAMTRMMARTCLFNYLIFSVKCFEKILQRC